ncbi:MAG: ATP-binding protein [Lachnoclostridium sp.]|jgi:hypothetical protein|nr:ATP-binding protein [Lachnoclostridium sp.]
METKPLPIGIEDFEKMITGEYYYIDKTGMIKELLDNKEKVNLFTRPRRFGKSLNMSMLQCYFENNEKDSRMLFKGLQIMNAGQKYLDEMNQYPVISITLKDANQSAFSSSFYHIKQAIHSEYCRHSYLLKSTNLDESHKKAFKRIYTGTPDVQIYSDSIKFLSKCLELHHKKSVLLFIDEYDVPLENAYFHDYYDEMVDFMRSLLGSALKSNPSLAFAVMTGCLRISKENIFTGLNNLNMISILSDQYSEYFGFTEKEAEEALAYYHLEEKKNEMREWYNGYYFGESNIYNPWSVIKYLYTLRANKNRHPDPHWSNTSSNNIIRELIEMADNEAKEEIEHLIRRESITKPIFEDIVYAEIKNNMNNLWSFLFFTGYLKKIGETFDGIQRYLTLTIPNTEVLYIYKRKIREWFDERIKINNPSVLIHAILNQDTATITRELNKRLEDIISFHDTAENFYHGFLLGILSNINGYQVKSNRETGFGRSDIYMKSSGIKRIAIIFECKALKKGEEAVEKGKEALRQIEVKNYSHNLISEGYHDIRKYAAVFRGKECLILCDDKS